MTPPVDTPPVSTAPVSTPVAWRERSRLVRRWRLLRTRAPRTFTEKVRYKMLRDHRRLVVTWSDKAAVRDYITEAVGSRYLPEAYAVLDGAAELRALHAAGLPPACVVKPTHGSGAVLAISPDAPADAVVPDPGEDWVCRFVRPEAVDPERLERLAAGWLARLHGHGPNFEWAYGLVPRRILVEELLTGPDGSPPDDYKLFVFNGQCRFVQFDANRFVRHAQAFFDRDWRQLHFHTGCPPAEPVPSRPAHLAEMIEVAERIGRDTDMVRVDFYLVGDRIVVGELTSYPGAGATRFCPPSYDAEFGRYWTVPARYV